MTESLTSPRSQSDLRHFLSERIPFVAEFFPVAENGKFDGAADFHILQKILDGVVGVKLPAVHGKDDISFPETGFRGGIFRDDRRIRRAFADDERAEWRAVSVFSSRDSSIMI